MPQPQLFRRGDGFRVRDPPDRFDPVERRPLAVQPVDDPGVVFPSWTITRQPGTICRSIASGTAKVMAGAARGRITSA